VFGGGMGLKRTETTQTKKIVGYLVIIAQYNQNCDHTLQKCFQAAGNQELDQCSTPFFKTTCPIGQVTLESYLSEYHV